MRSSLTALAFLTVLAPCCVRPALSQQTTGDQSPAISTMSGNVTVNYTNTGLAPEQLAKLIVDVTGRANADAAEARQQLSELQRRLGVTEGAALTLLRVLGQQDVAVERLPQKLGEITAQYKQAIERVAGLDPQDPITRDLVTRAQAEITAGHLKEADQLLSQAEQAEIAAAHQAQQFAQQAQEAADERLLHAANARGTRGNIALAELRYMDAANHFHDAANLVPAGHPDDKGRLLLAEADALQQQGQERGDNGALTKAIATFQLAEREYTRQRVPLQWAIMQNDLGITLTTAGERETGTEHLEQAVQAFRHSLEEISRDREPDRWAAAENNIGVTLWKLSERETGTLHLEQSLEALRLALQERPHAHMPLEWAMTENNIAITLWELGKRETGTEHLVQSVEAFRLALEEFAARRDRNPILWAMAENNLGNTLATLGLRETGTEHLEQSVEAFRLALQEFTRDRAPVRWAMTENNLGITLTFLSGRATDTASLARAADAFRLALQEFAPDRTPFPWAQARFNLGVTLWVLGERAQDRDALRQALDSFEQAKPVLERGGLTQQAAAAGQRINELHHELGPANVGSDNLQKPSALIDDRRQSIAPAQEAR